MYNTSLTFLLASRAKLTGDAIFSWDVREMRQLYLNQMGVAIWQLRHHEQIPEIFFYATLYHSSRKAIGLIVADISASHQVALNEQTDLLKKIAEALTSSVAYSQDIFLKSIDDFSFVILLGSHSSDAFAKNNFKMNRLIRSFSLHDLIKNVNYKKSLWSEIKLLKECFQ